MKWQSGMLHSEDSLCLICNIVDKWKWYSLGSLYYSPLEDWLFRPMTRSINIKVLNTADQNHLLNWATLSGWQTFLFYFQWPSEHNEQKLARKRWACFANVWMHKLICCEASTFWEANEYRQCTLPNFAVNYLQFHSFCENQHFQVYGFAQQT